MPVYTFRCRKCGKEYEALVNRFGQVAPCPACGDAKPEKILSLIAGLFGFGKSAAGRKGCAPRGRSGFG